MALVDLTPPLTAGDDARAADVMALLQKIVDQVNGNLDRDNLKDLEVITSKLAAGAVTDPKSSLTGAGVDTLDGRLKLSTGLIKPNADLVRNSISAHDFGWEDLSGASVGITPDVACTLIGMLVMNCELSPFSGGFGTPNGFFVDAKTQVALDGVRQGSSADSTFQLREIDIANDTYYLHFTSAQVVRFNLSAAPHTVKLQGHINVVTLGQGRIAAGGTNFLYALIAQ